MQSFYKISRVWDFARPYDYRCLMQCRHTPLPGWNDNIYDNDIPCILLIVFLCNFLNSQYDIYFESEEQKMPCLIPYITIAKGRRRLETRRDQGISRRYTCTIGDGLITSNHPGEYAFSDMCNTYGTSFDRQRISLLTSDRPMPGHPCGILYTNKTGVSGLHFNHKFVCALIG